MKQVKEGLDFLIVLAIVFFFLLFGFLNCGHDEKRAKETPLLQQAQTRGEQLYESIISSPNPDSMYVARCDKLTFKGLLSAYRPQDLTALEDNGSWSRDNLPCYPDNSKSSISLDGIMSVLHHIVSTRDVAMLDRLISYGEAHNWVMGEGPTEYTRVALLVPIIYSLQDRLSLRNVPLALDMKDQSVTEILSGFRGHLLASYIWLSLKSDGKINELELAALKKLVEANPEDPMYQALYHRVTDGDQSVALTTLLTNETFSDQNIEQDGVFGWGSAPAKVYYLATLAIIGGN